MRKYILFYISLILLTACKPKVEEFEPSKGQADFTRYVALGNSLTAGYASGALYISGQQNSYPSILAGQFAKVGGGAFKQPLMKTELGLGIDATMPPYFFTKRSLQLRTDCKGVTSLSPYFAGTANPQQDTASIASQGPFNNLGVPGAKSFHLLAKELGYQFPTGNPFYRRFASNAGTSSVLTDALAQNPTFFSLWIGNNDVLLYAIGGGDQGTETITATSTFDFALTSLVNALTGNGAKGVIANIPDITSIPYFTTVPYNGLVLTNQSDVTALNTAYGNGALGFTFKLGQNPFIIEDQSLSPPYQFRPIKSTELVLLSIPQDSLKCRGWGSQKPIPAKYILDESEIAKVQSATTSYNATLSSLASSKGLAYVDANALLKSLKPGITFQGITLTSTFVTGGAFSLDGIHLTPRGYAVVANTFIDAINSKYQASIPKVNVSDYTGVEFP